MSSLNSKLTIRLGSNPEELLPLYQELLEDVKSDIIKTKDQCLQSLKKDLEHGEKAYVFSTDGETVGYALINTNRTPVYIHHFYISRSQRRKGWGRTAFALLQEELNTSDFDLDVFVWNERGLAFWRSLGFEPRMTMMRRITKEQQQT